MEKPATLGEIPTGSSMALRLARNEVTGRIVKSIVDCAPVTSAPPAGITVTVYSLPPFTTSQPSYKGARVGDWLDPVVPLAGSCLRGWGWIDVAVSKTVAPGIYAFSVGDLPVSVQVLSFTVNDKPSTPLYMSVGSWALVLGHGWPTATTGVQAQAALTQAYVNELRAHRIEPYNQTVTTPSVAGSALNLDQWQEFGGSFRQLVMNGALAPIGLIMPNPTAGPTAAYLQAAQASILAEPGLTGAWDYVLDEPTSTQLADLTARLSLAKANAPLLKTMVTTLSTTTNVDYNVWQFEQWKTGLPANSWAYGACPSHGSCANGFLGTATGTPDLMIDEPSIHARMYPIVAAALGAKAILYYNTVEDYGRQDAWTDQYDFGGNGDGQLFYPGTPAHGFSDVPIDSLRLKLLRQGMYDVEYLKSVGFGSLVTSAKVWTKNHADIEAIRAQVQ